MSTLVERKRAELGAKRGSLEAELTAWAALAEEGGPLEKHHSQLQRMQQVLTAAAAEVTAPGDEVASWRAVTDQLLGLHHVWDFFRSKLALRFVEGLRSPLEAADELAWACAKPFYEAAVASGQRDAAAVREPALVYFDAGGSPFSVARHQAYRSLLPARRLDEVPASLLQHLPVPVIGIPWHQQAHLAETAIVAHEAAHVVDDDLDLVDTLLPLVEQRLGVGRAAVWVPWLHEVLADVSGALQLGPAYGMALLDVLATPTVAAPAADVAPAAGAQVVGPVASAPVDPSYPPPSTRLALVVATLRAAGHEAAAAELDAAQAALHAGEPDPDFLADIADVADVLTGEPLPVLGGKALGTVAPFDATLDRRAADDASRVLGGVGPEHKDVRVLVAAAVRAFWTDPSGFTAGAGPGLVLAAIERARTPGTRAGGPEDTVAGLAAALAQRDAATGAELLALL